MREARLPRRLLIVSNRSPFVAVQPCSVLFHLADPRLVDRSGHARFWIRCLPFPPNHSHGIFSRTSVDPCYFLSSHFFLIIDYELPSLLIIGFDLNVNTKLSVLTVRTIGQFSWTRHQYDLAGVHSTPFLSRLLFFPFVCLFLFLFISFAPVLLLTSPDSTVGHSPTLVQSIANSSYFASSSTFASLLVLRPESNLIDWCPTILIIVHIAQLCGQTVDISPSGHFPSDQSSTHWLSCSMATQPVPGSLLALKRNDLDGCVSDPAEVLLVQQSQDADRPCGLPLSQRSVRRSVRSEEIISGPIVARLSGVVLARPGFVVSSYIRLLSLP